MTMPHDFPDLNEDDVKQALRMPVLFAFFETRTVDELMNDLSWLVQYLRFRAYRDQLARNEKGGEPPPPSLSKDITVP